MMRALKISAALLLVWTGYSLADREPGNPAERPANPGQREPGNPAERPANPGQREPGNPAERPANPGQREPGNPAERPVAQRGEGTTTARGMLKKVDAKEGTITLTTKARDGSEKDMDFKVTDTTKVIVAVGAEKKEFKGKDGLKQEQFKEGATVVVSTDGKGQVTEVHCGVAQATGR